MGLEELLHNDMFGDVAARVARESRLFNETEFTISKTLDVGLVHFYGHDFLETTLKQIIREMGTDIMKVGLIQPGSEITIRLTPRVVIPDDCSTVTFSITVSIIRKEALA